MSRQNLGCGVPQPVNQIEPAEEKVAGRNLEGAVADPIPYAHI